MTFDNLFRKRFVVAWNHSRNLRQVASRLGGVLTVGEVWATARQLRREGLDLSQRPAGVGLLGHVYFFGRSNGEYQDLRGRDAYRVGAGTLVEGPWTCRRCGERMVRGFCVLSGVGDRHWFVCRRCVRVVD
jgi:hypothetical protein